MARCSADSRVHSAAFAEQAFPQAEAAFPVAGIGMDAVILGCRHNTRGPRQSGCFKQPVPEPRRTVGKKDGREANRTVRRLILRNGDAHGADAVHVVMQCGGGLGRGGETQAQLQVFCHCSAEASAHVGAVQPDGSALCREFADACGHLKRGRGQNETGPVFRGDAGNGEKGILCAAADVQRKYGAAAAGRAGKFGYVHRRLFRCFNPQSPHPPTGSAAGGEGACGLPFPQRMRLRQRISSALPPCQELFSLRSVVE